MTSFSEYVVESCKNVSSPRPLENDAIPMPANLIASPFEKAIESIPHALIAQHATTRRA